MILMLLISLAFLIWAIQREAELVAAPETIQVVDACPGCSALIEPEWLVCPHCRDRLSESCRHCHRGKLLSQSHCPYCGVAATGGSR